MNSCEKDFIIEYTDIDKNNKLSYFGFLKYLQEIGCIHVSELGFGLYETYKTGLAWILLDWKVQIFNKPSWNTKIHVKTWPAKVEFACCFREYEIYDENGNLLCKATSKWVLYNIFEKKIAKISDDIILAFDPCNKRVFETEIEKLKEPSSFESIFNYTISRRDIDTNSHVNNLNYINFALEALPNEVFSNCNFSSIEIMYKHECLLGDSISCLYSKISDNEYVVTIKSNDLKYLHAIIRLKI